MTEIQEKPFMVPKMDVLRQMSKEELAESKRQWELYKERMQRKAAEPDRVTEDMEKAEATKHNSTIIPKGEPNGVIAIVIEYEGRQYKLID